MCEPNLCRPDMAPSSAVNVHVLEDMGPFGGCSTGGVCLFGLGLCYVETSFVGDREPCQYVQCRICR